MNRETWRALLRWAGLAVLAGFFGFWLLLAGLKGALWLRTGTAPEQPIDFPHTVHAGRMGLACTFCHLHAEVSPQAGVPPLEKCMACHESVAVERPEVQKLRRHFQEKRLVVWRRVHELPDHVRFTHERHLRAGLACAACHGGVAQMERVRQVRSLQMGWCVNCHRRYGAPTDCTRCHK